MTRTPLKIWTICLCLFLGVPVCLLLGLWAWARWANTVPAYRLPPERLPNPNGYVRAAVLATKLGEARGGARQDGRGGLGKE